jgi:hypothetical protein
MGLSRLNRGSSRLIRVGALEHPVEVLANPSIEVLGIEADLISDLVVGY